MDVVGPSFLIRVSKATLDPFATLVRTEETWMVKVGDRLQDDAVETRIESTRTDWSRISVAGPPSSSGLRV